MLGLKLQGMDAKHGCGISKPPIDIAAFYTVVTYSFITTRIAHSQTNSMLALSQTVAELGIMLIIAQ